MLLRLSGRTITITIIIIIIVGCAKFAVDFCADIGEDRLLLAVPIDVGEDISVFILDGLSVRFERGDADVGLFFGIVVSDDSFSAYWGRVEVDVIYFASFRVHSSADHAVYQYAIGYDEVNSYNGDDSLRY